MFIALDKEQYSISLSMVRIPILQFVEPQNIIRYKAKLQDSVYLNTPDILSNAYVLRINNECGEMVCKYLAPPRRECDILDKLDSLNSEGHFPYYILLPEFQSAGICCLDWWGPILNKNELDSMIQENSMSKDFDGLKSWIEQLIMHGKEI